MKADEPADKRGQRLAAALLAAGLALPLSIVVFRLPEDTGLSGAVQGYLVQSGVSNSVTAVLLNFRGYDTLLEICVLILALTGVMTLSVGKDHIAAYTCDPVLSGLARILVPSMILVSGYLLYEGSHAPGGAFQAGAVLGSAMVLSRLAGLLPLERYNRIFLTAAIPGFAVFLFIAAMPIAAGRIFFEYPPVYANILIFIIEAFLTVSIAIILYTLFSGASAIKSANIPGGGTN